MRTVRCLASILVACVVGCARPVAPTSPGAPVAAAAPEPVDLAIRGVRVFDGTAVLASATVRLRGGRIVRVASDGRDSPATTVIDGAGMTLLPGLIDAHAHLDAPDGLRQALVFGVTTQLDMFALPADVRALHRIERGKGGATLSDFRSAGILATAPGGHDPKARGAARTRHALRITGTVVAGEVGRWAGAMFSPGATAMAPANLERFKVLTFWARADRELEATVMLFAEQLGPIPGRRPFTVGPRWTQHRFPLAELATIDPYDIVGVFVGVTRVGTFALEIDELRLE